MHILPSITVRLLTIVTVLTAVAVVVPTVAPAVVPALVVAAVTAFNPYCTPTLCQKFTCLSVYFAIYYIQTFERRICYEFHVYVISRWIINHYYRCYRCCCFIRGFCRCCRSGYRKLITQYFSYRNTTGTSYSLVPVFLPLINIDAPNTITIPSTIVILNNSL